RSRARSRSNMQADTSGSMPFRRMRSRRRCMPHRRTGFSAGCSRWAAWARPRKSLTPSCISRRRRSSPARSSMSTAAGPPVAARRGAMWPDRRLVELFDIEHPIVLAPMAGFGTIELAAAVADAGGLGSIGCGTMDQQLAADTIARLRRLTSKPINANFFCHDPAQVDAGRERAWHDRLCGYYRELEIASEQRRPRIDLAPFGDAMCEVVEDAKPEVVSFHFGLPHPALLARVQAAGCKVVSSATTVEEARWLDQRGVDAVIAQGYEAGGHRGMFLDWNRSGAVAAQV